MNNVPMKDRYESKTMELTSKQQEQAKVDQDIAEFLAKGKEITEIPNGMSGEMFAKAKCTGI